jgi:hypothetical protein
MAADTGQPQYAWAVQFPYGSPAHVRQWEDRKVTVPAELITGGGLVPAAALSMSVEHRERANQKVKELEEALAKATADNLSPKEIRKIERRLRSARDARRKQGLRDLELAQTFPSRIVPERKSSVSELEDLAANLRSLPVHPAQLYASIQALLLSGFLGAVLYHRKRHGVVIGLLLLLYPIARVTLEIIRVDNPHDIGALTVSQSLSFALFLSGALWLFVLYRFLPERSKVADAARPREEAGS